MSYIVVEHEISTCSCYKCKDRVAAEQFKTKINELISTIGFLPRNYDATVGYNEWGFIKGNKVRTDSNRLSDLVEYLTEANVKNSALKKKLGKSKRKHYTYCWDCGTYHLIKPQHIIEGHYLCQICMKNRYFVCGVCGEVHRREGGIATGEGLICLKCRETHFAHCKQCGNVARKDRFKKVRMPHKSGNLINKFATVCGSCYEGFTPCIKCNYDYHVGRENVARLRGKYVCSSCVKLGSKLNHWEFKPVPIYWVAPAESINTASLLFGVELEVTQEKASGGEENVKPENSGVIDFIGRFQSMLGDKFAYCKTDSSIKSGFEIITHPFTWEFYKLNTKRWETFLGWAVNNGVTVNDTCGIHVHMSKDAFTPCHLYKFINFFYSKVNRLFIYKVSQRTNMEKFNKYCPFLDRDVDNQKACARAKQNLSQERHSAINLMCAATVEVRIFEARLEPPLFFKNVEFCHAAFMFTKQAEKFDIKYSKFLKFVKNNQKMYPNLYSFLKEENFKL